MKPTVKVQKIFCVVVCGCGSWTGSFREEHNKREFQNRVLRKVFGCKTEKLVGGWRKLHNEEVHDLVLDEWWALVNLVVNP